MILILILVYSPANILCERGGGGGGRGGRERGEGRVRFGLEQNCMHLGLSQGALPQHENEFLQESFILN